MPKRRVKHQFPSRFSANYYRISPKTRGQIQTITLKIKKKREAESEITSSKTLLFLKIESGSKKRQKAAKRCVKQQILRGFRAKFCVHVNQTESSVRITPNLTFSILQYFNFGYNVHKHFSPCPFEKTRAPISNQNSHTLIFSHSLTTLKIPP